MRRSWIKSDGETPLTVEAAQLLMRSYDYARIKAPRSVRAALHGHGYKRTGERRFSLFPIGPQAHIKNVADWWKKLWPDVEFDTLQTMADITERCAKAKDGSDELALCQVEAKVLWDSLEASVGVGLVNVPLPPSDGSGSEGKGGAGGTTKRAAKPPAGVARKPSVHDVDSSDDDSADDWMYSRLKQKERQKRRAQKALLAKNSKSKGSKTKGTKAADVTPPKAGPDADDSDKSIESLKEHYWKARLDNQKKKKARRGSK